MNQHIRSLAAYLTLALLQGACSPAEEINQSIDPVSGSAINRSSQTDHGETFDEHNHTWRTVDFTAPFGTPPVVVAAISSFNGSDPAGLRIRNVSSTGVSFRIEEERSFDREIGHAGERIAYLAFEEGYIHSSEGDIIGEAKKISQYQPSGEDWEAVETAHNYIAPIVLMNATSYVGGHPGHVRLRNVTNDRFEFQFEEWDYLDGAHARENFSYLVIESGFHTLFDGTEIYVGATHPNRAWTPAVTGLNHLPRGVISQIQTTDTNNPALVARQRQNPNNPTAHTDIRLQAEETKARDPLAVEMVGFISFSTHQTSDLVDHGETQAEYNHGWKSMSFSSPFDTAPAVIASISSFNGSDTVGLRLRNVSATEVSFRAEEEKSRDNEVAHAPETVAYMAFEDGAILSRAGDIIGEARTISWGQPNRNTWRTVAMLYQHRDPIVFMNIQTFAGAAPGHIRIRNVTSTSFEFQLEEWDYLDGIHAGEKLSIVVFERGHHTLADTTMIIVGRTDTAKTWTTAATGLYGLPPAVITQCQTANNGEPLVARQRPNATYPTAHTDIRLQAEEQYSTRQLVSETVGWISFDTPQPQPETPWQTNANGSLFTDRDWNYAMGYHFSPLADGQIHGLGGFFNGTKTIKLFDRITGAVLAETVATAQNSWAYGTIPAVEVTAYREYTVAVYLAGSGGSFRGRSVHELGSEAIDHFPQTYGNIRIISSTEVHTGANSDARPTSFITDQMNGQADIEFVATSQPLPEPGQASYDPLLGTPVCDTVDFRCDTGGLVEGRGQLWQGVEPNAPNTLDGCQDGSAGGPTSNDSLNRLVITSNDGSPFAPGQLVTVDATVYVRVGDTDWPDFFDLYYAPDATNPTWQYLATMPGRHARSQVLSMSFMLTPGGAQQAIRGQWRYGGSNMDGPCAPGNYNDRDDLVFRIQ